jgi:N-terminal acetyltransferase B complex non-catalytic subunit
VDSLASLVKQYFDRFASKMCCFDDLYPYLDVLSSSETSALVQQLAQEVETLAPKVRRTFLRTS